MTYVPVDVPAFGGLVGTDPEDGRGASSILNLSLADPSILKSRPGYVVNGTENLSAATSILVAGSSYMFVGGASTTLKLMNSAGSLVASKTNYSSGDVWSLVRYGATGALTAYGGNGSALAKYDVSGGFTAPTVSTRASGASSFTGSRAAPKPYAVGVQPLDNRLVAAGFSSTADGPNGVASGGSHVFFSQPDLPESWDETDFVVLDRNDGETIRAVAVFNNMLFVFKRTKFFVFYGNSTDADGGAVFNYRAVPDAFPGNLNNIMPGNVCVGPDGVYVLTSSGVWLTTGGRPQLVSGDLAPLFTNETITLASTGYYGTGGAFYSDGNVYFHVTYGGTTFRWLVLNTRSGAWSVYDYADDMVVGGAFNVTGTAGIAMPSGVSTTNRKGLAFITPTYTTDNSTAISWHYTSSYSALGSPGVEKTVRQTELHGSGTVDVSWGKDLQSHGYARSVTMLNGRGLDRTSVRGESLSWKVSGSGALSLNRVIPFLREQRASGVKT